MPSEGLGAHTASAEINATEATSRYNSPKWQMVWNDEFEEPGLPDPAKWDYEKGLKRNKEAQYYTVARPENVAVRNGMLVITARKEPWEGASYTSASLTTRNAYPFTYGKVEVRAKVPRGVGTWPAIWTLAANIDQVRWPLSGEIDLMEYVGFDPDGVHVNVHTEAFNHTKHTNKGTRVTVPEAWREFHTFGIIWSEDRIEWFLDGKPIFAFANDGKGVEHWPFFEPQYLILNLAIGGSWGGIHGIDDSSLPAEFQVDYVRIWQHKE